MIADDDAYLCHCRMCQRSTGSVSIAFKNISKAALSWLTPPDYFASSPIARRGFCATCGTSLSFEFPDGENIDLTVAAFDDPRRFQPRSHFGIESRLEHWRDVSGLPESRADQDASTVDKWMKSVGKFPD
jgi:hypothetical protein